MSDAYPISEHGIRVPTGPDDPYVEPHGQHALHVDAAGGTVSAPECRRVMRAGGLCNDRPGHGGECSRLVPGAGGVARALMRADLSTLRSVDEPDRSRFNSAHENEL